MMTRRANDAAAEQPAAVVETHVSTLFFVGDRVYKRKKPVSFPFLDFSTLERRRAACRREVALNRRLSPDVYLGVSTVLDVDRRPCDYLVTMKRLPDERRLAALVSEKKNVDAHLRRIAHVLASFHARADTSDEIARAGGRDAVLERWERNFEEMSGFVGRYLPPVSFERVGRLAHAYLAGRDPLFRQRISDGRVRDGHGDLQAADIFCLDDGPRILDCIEFDDQLRYADVAADVAYLAMDLERLGSPWLGARFAHWYREFSDDSFPSSLLDHYIAYRAVVRSKVACLRAEQNGARHEARALLELARAHLVRARPLVVLVGGLPGTGKSTLAAGLSEMRRLILLRSDEVRKDIARLPHLGTSGTAYGSGTYSRRMTEATYAELLDRARRAIEMGESVILDATWANERFRRAARTAANDSHAELVQIRCVTSRAVAEARITARDRSDASDATTDIAEKMSVAFDPWPEARQLDTTGGRAEILQHALSRLEALDARYSDPDVTRFAELTEGARRSSA